MKNALSSTCLAATMFCMASIGYAADSPQPAMMQGPHAQHHGMQDPVANAQKRLDALGAKLHLQSSQQDAWKTFSAAMIKHAQDHAQEMQKRVGERSKHEDIATPDRMEKMAAAMRQGADHMSKLASDTKPFYDQLNPEQKTIFDLYAKNAWHNRMMRHPMH